MQYKFVTMFVIFMTMFRFAHAETLTLDFLISSALDNSPETFRILKDSMDSKSRAFETETLKNPNAEINIMANRVQSSRRIGVEFEQPLRLSNFGSRGSYAEAIRNTSDMVEKAKILELMHSVMRSYASYWILQEQERLVSQNVNYMIDKNELIELSVNEGRVDLSDSKVFSAEVLRYRNQLRNLRSKKSSSAVNLLRMAGLQYQQFEAVWPANTRVPDLASVVALVNNETSIRSLMRSRNTLAERRYAVAREDAGFPEFAPRAIIEHDFGVSDTTLLLGVNISIPIWDRNNAELARAKAEKKLAQANLELMNESNFISVLTLSFNKVELSHKSVYTYRNEVLPLWKDIQAIADEKFRNGQVSVFDLLQIRERLTNVQREMLQADLDFMEAQIELESLLGQPLKGIVE